MSANRSKKLIRENHKQARNEENKRYCTTIADFVINTAPAAFYVISFLAYAFYRHSIDFSVELALFSSCITLAFEAAEWINMSRRKFIMPIEALRYTPGFPLWLAMPFLMFILLSYVFIKFMTKIDIEKYSIIPNVISAFSLLLFLILYIARIIMKIRREHKKRLSQLK